MERGPNDHIGPGAELEEEAPPAGTPRASVTPETIARTCYAVNSVYCRIIGDTPRDWDECKGSVLAGVEKALAGATPEQLHDAWCQFQIAEGWSYGTTKDATAKTHPCLLPYDELPVEQRNKDQFFLAVVESLKPYL